MPKKILVLYLKFLRTILLKFNFQNDGIFMIHLIWLIYILIMESMKPRTRRPRSFPDGGIDKASSHELLDNLEEIEDLFHKKIDYPKK